MNAMRKSVEASEKAEYYHRKAEAAANKSYCQSASASQSGGNPMAPISLEEY